MATGCGSCRATDPHFGRTISNSSMESVGGSRGAPWSMNMGMARPPFLYDNVIRIALPPPKLRLPLLRDARRAPQAEALMRRPRYPTRILIAALISALVASAQPRAAAESDPHRPVCVDAQCRKIMSFLKAHYCSESADGNGQEDGCQITIPKARPGVDVVADFECEWSDAKRAMDCKQQGEPSALIRSVLTRELRRLGLPAKAKGQTYFIVWKSTASGWSLVAANYVRTASSNIELCQVIVVIDQSSRVLVLRKSPLQKTDVDKLPVTQWSPIDLADVEGDGQVDVVLRVDAYEDHWLEVVSVGRGSARTVFSGLGYAL